MARGSSGGRAAAPSGMGPSLRSGGLPPAEDPQIPPQSHVRASARSAAGLAPGTGIAAAPVAGSADTGAFGTAAGTPEKGILAYGPLLLAVFFASLMIPGSFTVAGFSLSPYRVVLIIAFVPLFLRWSKGEAGQVTAGDLAILLYCLWIWVALFANHGTGRIHTAGIQFAEMFGGYLIGRTLVRDSAGFRRFVRLMLWALLFLLPLGVVELLTGWSPLRTLFEPFLEVEPRHGNLIPRLGFQHRVQGPFGHSILFGLFCSLAVANVFYCYRGTIVRRLGALGVALVTVFISLSSAPLISAGLQIAMMAWDRLLAFVQARWIILVGGSAILFGGLHFLYPGGVLGLVIENLIFIPMTGYARIEVFEFGIQSVYAHPIFGIGYNDWRRAFWMEHPTMDNFWLVIAVHYGVPSLLLLWVGIAFSVLRSLFNPVLDEEERAQRTGYLMALVGLLLVLGTVALWGAVSTFVLTYIGAGGWFGRRREVEERRRQRRSRLEDREAAAPDRPADLPGGRPADPQGTPPRGGGPAAPGGPTAAGNRPRPMEWDRIRSAREARERK